MNDSITTLVDTEFYLIKINENLSANKLYWKDNQNLNLVEFKKGIIDFAKNCKMNKPTRAVIDARKLDLSGDPFLWVSGQKKISGIEEYSFWWAREIAPFFNEAEILGLGVANGDPSAPGELPQSPEGVNFRIGYFTTLDAALDWNLE